MEIHRNGSTVDRRPFWTELRQAESLWGWRKKIKTSPLHCALFFSFHKAPKKQLWPVASQHDQGWTAHPHASVEEPEENLDVRGSWLVLGLWGAQCAVARLSATMDVRATLRTYQNHDLHLHQAANHQDGQLPGRTKLIGPSASFRWLCLSDSGIQISVLVLVLVRRSMGPLCFRAASVRLRTMCGVETNDCLAVAVRCFFRIFSPFFPFFSLPISVVPCQHNDMNALPICPFFQIH